jgi:hypothetical protein
MRAGGQFSNRVPPLDSYLNRTCEIQCVIRTRSIVNYETSGKPGQAFEAPALFTLFVLFTPTA